MVTGNAQATSNSVFLRPIIEDALAKLLSFINCENVYTEDLPPVTTEQEFTQRLQVHKGLAQPEYEGWFVNRRTVRNEVGGVLNSHQYNQVHGMIITGLAYHGSFHDSYRYVQDKTEELIWTLEKNKNVLGDNSIQFINNVSSDFVFEQYGEMYLYRSNTSFDINRMIIEADGRSFS